MDSLFLWIKKHSIQKLGHGLHMLTAELRSTQSSVIKGMIKNIKLLDWVTQNNDGECGWQQNTGGLNSQVGWVGLTVGSHVALFHIHQIHQVNSYHNSTINILMSICITTSCCVHCGQQTRLLQQSALWHVWENFDRLQRTQNTLARIVFRASWSASASDLLRELHWLPIRQRVWFKLVAVTFKAKHSSLPAYQYLHDDIHDYQPTRMLQSSTAHLLQQPLVLTSVASRAFTVAAPTVWNSLSVNTWSADSFASFKHRLKTELYASTYAT